MNVINSHDDVAELDKDERRLGGLLYDLTFINVTTKDAQVIQCNISNKHGYNFTNAYINVYSQYCTVFSQNSTCLLCTINTITALSSSLSSTSFTACWLISVTEHA